ncbi:MAG: hypothetical protein HY824_09170 [Acidobacteria bacterium]|nr:hypothetical protein [Acidobacteriota bacterium]
MTTRSIRALALASLALLASAAMASAQTQSSVILNALEVRRLVAGAEPADHARLYAHFTALADRYADEAGRHMQLARAMGGNPNRHMSRSSSAHCTRLAELNASSAATLRELATHHEQLASGFASTAPADGARFENGEGAAEPTDAELTALAAGAHTPADHRSLEEYFLTLASRYTADAAEHTAMASAYRGNANRRGADPAVHCDRLVKQFGEAADEARTEATEHRIMAGLR